MIEGPPNGAPGVPVTRTRIIWPLHFAVPVLGLGVRGPEDFKVPLAAAPGLDDLGGDDVHEDFREGASFGIALQVIRLFFPSEIRVEDHRQEQVVAVVNDNDLAARPLDRRVIEEVLLGAVRADVALEGELARDDLLDGNLLLPAVAAIPLFAARL